MLQPSKVPAKIYILSCVHISLKINMSLIQTTRPPPQRTNSAHRGGSSRSLGTSGRCRTKHRPHEGPQLSRVKFYLFMSSSVAFAAHAGPWSHFWVSYSSGNRTRDLSNHAAKTYALDPAATGTGFLLWCSIVKSMSGKIICGHVVWLDQKYHKTKTRSVRRYYF
jgi:hypothetical protein